MKTGLKFYFHTKKWMFLLLFLTVCMQASIAQKIKWKDYLVTGSSMFVSGMLDGTIESINYHYESGFKPRFTNANDQFWNPALSWKNKYKNGQSCEGAKFYGSTNMFVFTTDAYHMLRTSKRAIDASTLVYYINDNRTCKTVKTKKERLKKSAIDFLVLTTIRCAGFHLTYSVMFKPVKN